MVRGCCDWDVSDPIKIRLASYKTNANEASLISSHRSCPRCSGSTDSGNGRLGKGTYEVLIMTSPKCCLVGQSFFVIILYEPPLPPPQKLSVAFTQTLALLLSLWSFPPTPMARFHP